MCESPPSEPNWLVLPGAPPVGSRPEQLVELIHQVSGRVALNRDSPALGSPDTPPCRALEATRPDLPEAALQVEDLGPQGWPSRLPVSPGPRPTAARGSDRWTDAARVGSQARERRRRRRRGLAHRGPEARRRRSAAGLNPPWLPLHRAARAEGWGIRGSDRLPSHRDGLRPGTDRWRTWPRPRPATGSPVRRGRHRKPAPRFPGGRG
jgi:hypothetical protein